MNSHVKTGLSRFQLWCLHNAWWFCLLAALFDLLSITRKVLQKHECSWDVFDLLFHLTGAVFFWFMSRHVKKLQASRFQLVERKDESPLQ